jgi:hypothetical protein
VTARLWNPLRHNNATHFTTFETNATRVATFQCNVPRGMRDLQGCDIPHNDLRADANLASRNTRETRLQISQVQCITNEQPPKIHSRNTRQTGGEKHHLGMNGDRTDVVSVALQVRLVIAFTRKQHTKRGSWIHDFASVCVVHRVASTPSFVPVHPRQRRRIVRRTTPAK